MNGIPDGLRISAQIQVEWREELRLRGPESIQTRLSQETVHKLAVLAFLCFTQRISQNSGFSRRSLSEVFSLLLSLSLSFPTGLWQPVQVGAVWSHLCSPLPFPPFSSLTWHCVQYLIIFKCVMCVFNFPSKGLYVKIILFLLFFKEKKAWLFLLQIEILVVFLRFRERKLPMRVDANMGMHFYILGTFPRSGVETTWNPFPNWNQI